MASDAESGRPDLSPEIVWGSVGSVLAAAGAAVFALAPTLPGRLTGCLLKAGTGWPCPTCGMTRAAEALAAGRPLAALAVNPLVVLTLAGGLIYLVYAWLVVLARLPPLRPGWLSPPMPNWLRWGLPAALAANWLYLILAGV